MKVQKFLLKARCGAYSRFSIFQSLFIFFCVLSPFQNQFFNLPFPGLTPWLHAVSVSVWHSARLPLWLCLLSFLCSISRFPAFSDAAPPTSTSVGCPAPSLSLHSRPNRRSACRVEGGMGRKGAQTLLGTGTHACDPRSHPGNQQHVGQPGSEAGPMRSPTPAAAAAHVTLG